MTFSADGKGAISLSIGNVALLGDPVPSFNFDVLVADKPVVEVTRVQVKAKQVHLHYVMFEDSQARDLSGARLTVRLYQKIGNNQTGDKGAWVDINYRLKELKQVLLDADAGFGNKTLTLVQVYDYESPSIVPSK